MILPRVIPVLLLKGKGLVKGVQFKDHVYVGDPINAVQIFNTKEADEILFLDISAQSENRIPSAEMISNISDQCLLPFGVGGGVKTVDDARILLRSGAEKVCLNTAAIHNPDVVYQISQTFGAQSVMVSIDVKKNFWGKYEVYTNCGTKNTHKSPVEIAELMVKKGVGELVINSIDRDGTLKGYDHELIKNITSAVPVPVIALGGASSIQDMKFGVTEDKCAGVAAGSFFVFHGKHRAVLINYPSKSELDFIRDSK